MIRYKFVDGAVRVEDLHPGSITDQERDLAKLFVSSVKTKREIDSCPICGAKRQEILFEKWGQRYALCPTGWSLALATMPSEKTLKDYFLHSDLSRFRASRKYQDVTKKMREGLWKNQLEWIEGRARRYLGMDKYNVIDWGCKSVGWSECLEKAGFVQKLWILDPLPPVNEASSSNRADIICLFDVVQRSSLPQKLLDHVASQLQPGGLLVITCRSGCGYDVLTLREKSESIYPFDHVTLPSPKEMQCLIEDAGLEVLELGTPGLLDLQFVKNVGSDIPSDQFFSRYLISKEDDLALERFQEFLQRNNFSSHMKVVARKPESRT